MSHFRYLVRSVTFSSSSSPFSSCRNYALNLILCLLVGRDAVDSQRLEQLTRPELHQRDLSGHLKQQKTLLHVTADRFRRAGRASEELAVSARRLDNARDRGIERWFILAAAQAQRERKIAGPDKQDVDARSCGDGINVIDCRGLFDDAHA